MSLIVTIVLIMAVIVFLAGPALETPLVTVGPDLRQEITTACDRNDAETMAELLSDDRRLVRAEVGSSWTPLHEAASAGSASVAQVLLSCGANPNDADRSGDTPLHEAARVGSVVVMRLLVAEGADVNVADAAGDTPLHAAAIADEPRAVRFLLAHRADSGARDVTGRTPLECARRSHNKAAVRAFSDRG